MDAELDLGTGKQRGRVAFLMRKFLAACELAYRRSLKGTLPSWVAELAGSGELRGGVEFASMPLAVHGYSGVGAVDQCISSWEAGDGRNPILENRVWAALLPLRPLKEFWTLELRDNHRVQLERLLAETWVVDPTPIPPHAVIPRLGIQRWVDAPRELNDGRGLALFLNGNADGGDPGMIWGPDVGEGDWKAALERAGETFSKGKSTVVQALPDRPEAAARAQL